MRDLASTLLDLVGGLLIVAALALWVASFSLPLALAAAGAGMLLLSWLPESRLMNRRRTR